MGARVEPHRAKADEARSEAASAWVARVQSDDARAQDWRALTAWFEADPANSHAFEAAALLDDSIARHAPAIAAFLPANDVAPAPGWKRWRWPGAALAAAIAAAALLLAPAHHLPAPSAFAVHSTGPRDVETLTLANGATVRLDCRTRLGVGAGGRRIELAQGATYLDVRHDPKRPLIVDLGAYQVRDIGTRFEVVRTVDRITVAVADGAVTLASVGATTGLTVSAGERIDLAVATGIAERRSVDPASVASWRAGVLRYHDAPLALVVRDLGRYSDRRLAVDPAIGDRRFSGVLALDDGIRMMARLTDMMQLRLVGTKGGAILVPRGGHDAGGGASGSG